MEESGYDVSVAFSGQECLDQASSKPPDLILLDIMMKTPAEGVKVNRLLKENEELKEIPVIVLTGIRSEPNFAFALWPKHKWLKAHAVLEKPVAPEQLLEAIRKNIAG